MASNILTIKTIPNAPAIGLIKFNPPFSTICSVGKAPFFGTIRIEFAPIEWLLEFESFEAWLKSMANDEQTIEDLCRRVFDALTDVLGPVPMSVTVEAFTTVHANAVAIIERKNP